MLGRVLTSSQTRILNPPLRLFFVDVKEVEKWSRKLAINIQTVVTAERGGMISLWTNTESPCDGSSEDESCCRNNNLFHGSGRRRRIYRGSAALELQLILLARGGAVQRLKPLCALCWKQDGGSNSFVRFFLPLSLYVLWDGYFQLDVLNCTYKGRNTFSHTVFIHCDWVW